MEGRVISYTGKFGFLDAAGVHIYFRASDCRCSPYRGDTVRFDIDDSGGKPKAVNVRAVRSAVVSEVDRVFGP